MGAWKAPAPSVVPFRKPRGRVSGKHAITRSVSNLPIRVPAVDWAKVVTGEKRMFRTYAHGSDPLGHVVPAGTRCPRPCLLYTQRGVERRWQLAPAILEAFWREPLGAISQGDLAREGFEYLPAFRYYWTTRYKTLGWRPWDEITVLEVSPMREADEEWAMSWLFDQLFVAVSGVTES